MSKTKLLLMMAIVVVPLDMAYAQSGEWAIESAVTRVVLEAEVPAQEAGPLTELTVKEGMEVREGEKVGLIDDRDARMTVVIAEKQYLASKAEAENDVSITAAQKSKQVSEMEWRGAEEANSKFKGSRTATEVRRLKFQWERSALQIDLAQIERAIAGLTARAKWAEVQRARAMVDRRQIKSPIDGMVKLVHRHKGEWVNPGDPVFHVVGLKRLRVEGYLNSADYAHHEVRNRGVEIEIDLPGQRKRTIIGKLGFASPEVEADGRYRVWAEFDNPLENGHWLVVPGLNARLRFQNARNVSHSK